MPIRTMTRGARRLRRFKSLVAAAACLYVLVNAFLILCLIHPTDEHSHSPADEQFDATCVWVQKAVSSHAFSARAFLPAGQAILFAMASFPLLVPLIRAVEVTGRSPPSTALA
jgi:hypothetical protein